MLWDIVGDNVLNRIKQNFGKQNQGYLRINPILNPLYMGYSERKGFVYKFDVRGSYSFSDDVQFALRFKAGYAFKQHRFYFSIPATLNYNKSMMDSFSWSWVMETESIPMLLRVVYWISARKR